MSAPALDALSQERPLLLDGGLGQELVARGVDTRRGLWSAQALLTEPELVLDVHRDFVAAGADVVTTNSYATTRRRLEPHGLERRFEELNREAGRLARRAAEESGRQVAIAGSLPPIHGSYRPDRVRAEEELVPAYREQAGLLAEHVDLLLCETMSSAAEARAAARGAAGAGLPVWVSWTLADDGSGRLRSGETIREALAALAGVAVQAVLVNCSTPESVGAAVPELAAWAGRPWGAYANGFSPIAADYDVADGAQLPSTREDLGPDRYAEHAAAWLAAGASIVGGCCEVTPSHIARLRELLGPGDPGRAPDDDPRPPEASA